MTAWEVARAEGLAGLTLRDVARRVGMRAPSLRSYFDSKHAIYDAMFAQGYRDYLAEEQAIAYTGDAMTDLRLGMRHFMTFSVSDPVRYQLMFQRVIPGFVPSAESYALSVTSLDRMRARLEQFGFTDPAALDRLTALGAGLTSQQVSNDPGGDRWSRLVDEAMEMLFTHLSHRNRQGGTHA